MLKNNSCKNFNTILFDLDGVIVDSAKGIANCANAALSHFGYKTLETSLIASFIGNGARRLIQDTLQAAEVTDANMKKAGITFEIFFSWYLAWYEKHAIEDTPLYKDVYVLLQSLKKKNIYLGLVTSKPLAITKIVLEHYSLDSFFDAVVCPEMITHLKPNPESLSLAIRMIEEKYTTKLTLANIVMVGDSASDIQAGHTLGCKTCAITGGIGCTKKLIAENADITLTYACELMELF